MKTTWALLTIAILPASAQVVLSGEWTPVYQEDFDERIPGPALVDYLGIPINDAARSWALAWDPDRLTLPEHQCQVHTAAYIYRGPLQLRMWEERDPESHKLIAIHNYISTYEQWRTIYMDDRPHPADYEKHTWMGFSTGKWQGDILVVNTSHIKQGWHRRNGIPSSDLISLTEYFIRHGDRMTHVSVVQDPVYLTEPLIKSQDYVLNTRPQPDRAWLWPCEYVDEAPGLKKGTVQSYMPGENPYVNEFADKHKIPVAAALGGADTAYPNYRAKLPGGAAAMGRPAPLPAEAKLNATPAAGSARALAKTDFTGDWVSVVTEDWLNRMVTPPKGVIESVPVNADARKIAAAWDPAKDQAAGKQCMAYGAPALLRIPGRLHVSWESDTALRIDAEAGTQTRHLNFSATPPQPGSAPSSLQGTSVAQWERLGGTTGDWAGLGGGPQNAGPGTSLRVMTANLAPGYLRKNGVPYSKDAIMTEFFDVAGEGANQWLIVTTVVQDPTYLTQPFVTSTHFKKLASPEGWSPSACSAQ
jgi:hypothetical protein